MSLASDQLVARNRVELRRMTPALAEQVVQGARAIDWEEDYPAQGDTVAAQMYLKQCADGRDPQPFGPYQIVRTRDTKIVGGAGIHGSPGNGVVEIGYGVVPSARGQGFATEAARCLLDIARAAAVRIFIAGTETTNPASMRVLERLGMRPANQATPGSTRSSCSFSRSSHSWCRVHLSPRSIEDAPARQSDTADWKDGTTNGFEER